ncbi:hypothetical protein L2E82_37497 [Cichorium intybus]|uniref:Uncharacterized protein n=1 Tax=Cichorium intybus TaxID=13427 RepID=A0ACB9AFA0_CICIN|nr:hypothetical protein L2E82_37497 [Cichorium intybus]
MQGVKHSLKSIIVKPPSKAKGFDMAAPSGDGSYAHAVTGGSNKMEEVVVSSFGYSLRASNLHWISKTLILMLGELGLNTWNSGLLTFTVKERLTRISIRGLPPQAWHEKAVTKWFSYVEYHWSLFGSHMLRCLKTARLMFLVSVGTMKSDSEAEWDAVIYNHD